MPRKIDISHRTIIFTTVFFLGLWVIYQVIDLILLLFIAIILMSALAPAVAFLHNLKLPKALCILLVYVIIIGILVGLLTISFTPLIEQTSKLIFTLPAAVSEILKINHIDANVFRE